MALKKKEIDIVLDTYYGKIRVINYRKDDEIIGEFDYPPEQYEQPKYSWEIVNQKDYIRLWPDSDDESAFSITAAYPKMHKAMQEHGDKYKRIELRWDYPDGYVAYPRIVGVRDETDEEFAARCEAYEQRKRKSQESAQKHKLETAAKQLEKKKKLYAKLKEELGVE